MLLKQALLLELLGVQYRAALGLLVHDEGLRLRLVAREAADLEAVVDLRPILDILSVRTDGSVQFSVF